MNGRRLFGAGVVAILAASAAGTVVLAMVGYVDDFLFLAPMLLMALIVAGVHFLFLGLPLAVFVAARWRIGWWNSALAGSVIGGVPLSAMLLGNADLDGVVLRGILPTILCLAGAGLVGGVVFRAAYGDDAAEAE